MEKIAFFCFLWTSSGKNDTLNFKNATRKCENRQTSKNALLFYDQTRHQVISFSLNCITTITHFYTLGTQEWLYLTPFIHFPSTFFSSFIIARWLAKQKDVLLSSPWRRQIYFFYRRPCQSSFSSNDVFIRGSKSSLIESQNPFCPPKWESICEYLCSTYKCTIKHR